MDRLNPIVGSPVAWIVGQSVSPIYTSYRDHMVVVKRGGIGRKEIVVSSLVAGSRHEDEPRIACSLYRLFEGRAVVVESPAVAEDVGSVCNGVVDAGDGV